jgi:hypothetical protein
MAFLRADDTTFDFSGCMGAGTASRFFMRGEVFWAAMYIARPLATV